MSLGNEYTLVEKPAIDYFKSLGYSYIDGRKLTPEMNERDSLNEVILTSRMKTSLQKLNPEISEENINKIIRRLQRPDSLGSGLLEINEKIYDYIVNLQLTVEEIIDNKKTKVTVKLIDFDNIDNNDFLVTNQFKVHGEQENIIPDIVVFINGMPIAVIECKSPFKEGNANENVGKYDY